MERKQVSINFFRRETGYTLIELIMVLVVLGILFSIAAKKMITVAQEAEITGEETTIELLRSNLVNNYSAELIRNATEGISTADYPDNPFDELNQVPYGYDRRQNNAPLGNAITNDTWSFVQGASSSNPTVGANGVVVEEESQTTSTSTAPTGFIYHQRKDGTVVKWSYNSNTGIVGEKEIVRTSALKQRLDRQKFERGEIIEGQKVRDLPGRNN